MRRNTWRRLDPRPSGVTTSAGGWRKRHFARCEGSLSIPTTVPDILYICYPSTVDPTTLWIQQPSKFRCAEPPASVLFLSSYISAVKREANNSFEHHQSRAESACPQQIMLRSTLDGWWMHRCVMSAIKQSTVVIV